MKLKVYLAGKISKNDWRHKIVPQLRGCSWDETILETPSFNYIGPFFRSCGHGCFHGPNTHGVDSDWTCVDEDHQLERKLIIERDMRAVTSADLIIAYITSTDCHGTLIELGAAFNAKVPVVMIFAPEVDPEDFWFATHQSREVHVSKSECCLPEIINASILESSLDIIFGGHNG